MSGDADGDPADEAPTDRRSLPGVLDGSGGDISASERVPLAPESVRSSREGKENVEPADAAAALEGVRNLEVATWNYASQDESVRHMGPMAEDFYAEFGLGADRERIATVDADGVAFGAIQALADRVDTLQAIVEDQRETIEAQRETITAQADRLDDVEVRLRTLEATRAEDAAD